MRLGIPLIILALSLAMPYHNAEATKTPNLKAVGIEIERSCQLSQKCVTYTDIRKFDNSPKTIGELVTIAGTTKRIATPKQDNPEWIRFSNQTMIIVDPPAKIADRIKIITIKTDLGEFHRPGQLKVKEYNQTDGAKATQNIREYSHSWYTDGCKIGVISGSQWKTLLPEMIEHLSSNCQIPMKTNNTSHDIKPLTKHDIKTSSKYKLEKWQDQIRKECLQKRNACTDLKQPTRAGL